VEDKIVIYKGKFKNRKKNMIKIKPIHSQLNNERKRCSVENLR